MARQYIDFFTIPFGGGADGLPYAHLLTALDSFRRGITIAQRHSATAPIASRIKAKIFTATSTSKPNMP